MISLDAATFAKIVGYGGTKTVISEVVGDYTVYTATDDPPPVDITGDGEINLLDLAKMAMQWGQSDCANNDWCDVTDLDMSGAVGLGDLAILASEWLSDDYAY